MARFYCDEENAANEVPKPHEDTCMAKYWQLMFPEPSAEFNRLCFVLGYT